jgi:hypothetical protein
VVFPSFCKVVKECVFPCCLVRGIAVFVSFPRSGVIRAGTEARAYCDNCAWLSLTSLSIVTYNQWL